MLYYPNGKPIPETLPPRPKGGSVVGWEPADREHLAGVGRGLDPSSVDAIMRAATSGDTAQMCALAEMIDDLSFAIGAALDTRRAAIGATKWTLEAGDETPRGEEIARAAEQMLRTAAPGNELLAFDEMVRLELGSALLPGFACPEIVWARGGTEVLGYNSIPQKHYTFVGSRMPLLVTTTRPEGVPLTPGKFVLHWHRSKGGSPTRGGLIRACAWMRAFESVNFKDLLRFTERYGMPFLVARVTEQSWKTEREVLQSIVRNFGPDGGAVMSKDAELELLEAGRSTGEIYFTLLEYLGKAAQVLILGQTATSGEGGGWSNDGAQHLVRMDIRSSDCGQLAGTSRARILGPWVGWNYGPDAPVPRMVFDVQGAKDAQAEATTIKTLDDAGWQVDEEQIERNTGYRVTRKAVPGRPDAAALGADEAAVGRALAAFLRTGGNAAALSADVAAEDAPELVARLALAAGRKAAGAMYAPLQARLDALAAVADDAQFARELAALGEELPGMLPDLDSAALEAVLLEAIHGAAAAGMAGRAAELKQREA